MNLSISNSWILTIVLLILWQKNVDAISCYICSWNPEDKEVEADRCTSQHFDERRVRWEDCKVGCEVVKILDANGELLMFYRNCLMSSPNKLAYDQGYKKATTMTEEEMFACDSDLCNAAAVVRNTNNILFVLLTSLLSSISSPI